MKRFAAAIVSTILLTAIPLLAHHSFGAEYDANKPITVTGVVTKIEWTNPHSCFYLDVKDEQGGVASWKFEGYPPGVLYRMGWRRQITIKPGDTIKVFGWQARDCTHCVHSREVIFADGKKLYFGPPAGTGDGGATPAVEIQ